MRTLLAFLFCLFAATGSVCAAAPAPCSMKLHIYKNGDVAVDGTRYSDERQLKLRLGEYKERHASCAMALSVDRGAGYRTVAHAITVVQELGFAKVGFLVEQRGD